MPHVYATNYTYTQSSSHVYAPNLHVYAQVTLRVYAPAMPHVYATIYTYTHKSFRTYTHKSCLTYMLQTIRIRTSHAPRIHAIHAPRICYKLYVYTQSMPHVYATNSTYTRNPCPTYMLQTLRIRTSHAPRTRTAHVPRTRTAHVPRICYILHVYAHVNPTYTYNPCPTYLR